MSDNGPQFTSSEFVDFLKMNHVKQTLVPAYHSASNGAAEKSVQTVKNALKKYLFEEYGSQKTTIQQKLDNFLLTYRTTPHSTTQCSPASLFYKRDLRTRFSLLRPDLQSDIAEKQEKQIKYHDRKPTRYAEFSENKTIRVRNYINGKPKWSIATVLKRLGEYRYVVLMDNHKHQVHVEQTLKFSAKCDQAQAPGIETVEHNRTLPVVIPTIPAHESKVPVDKFEHKDAMTAPEVLPVSDRNTKTSAHKVLPEPQTTAPPLRRSSRIRNGSRKAN